jgi:prophage tail gpP-like protein
MLRLKREEEELKRKEIEQLMREAVQAEKTQLAEEGAKRRAELEQDMRASVKEKLLEEYRN